ncbi:MAG: hypothetical protein KKC46_22320 [Proteobacteria bacterium]|nr:hypothetical protein [Pseudomonadota bacterium]
MIVKHVILPSRLRKVPKSFSWIDHRLISDRHIERLCHGSAALYLFLLCASDENGLSYYGDKSIMEKLSMDGRTLEQARSELIRTGLVAWQKPIYQILCLEPGGNDRASGSPIGLGDILKKVMEVRHD